MTVDLAAQHVTHPAPAYRVTPNPPPPVRLVATEHRCERVLCAGDRRYFCGAAATFAQRMVSYERFLCAGCVLELGHSVSGNDGITAVES